MESAALALARDGWNVFPLKPGTKKPLLPRAHERGSTRCHGECGRDGHGAWDGTTDVDTIRRWWTKTPNAGIGANLGEDRIAVDVDAAKGADLAILNRLPATRRHATAAGGDSQHLIFRIEPGSAASELRSGTNVLAPHVDIRVGLGSYIVMPPTRNVETELAGPDGKPVRVRGDYTVREDRPEHVLTDELVRSLWPATVARKRRTPAPRGTHPPNVPTDDDAPVTPAGARAALEVALREVREAPEGTRNDILNGKAYRLGRMVGADVLDRGEVETRLTEAALAAGLDPREVEATIASGLNAGTENPCQVTTAAAGGGQQAEQDTAITRVVDYAQQRYTFHRTPDGHVFAVPIEGVRRPVFITESGGGALKSMILADLYDEWTGKVPSGATIERALEVLHAKATRLQNTHTLDLRVARRGDALVIDLGQQGNARCVLVDGDGWHVLDNPPDGVLFRPSLRALPEPTRDGSLEPLRRLLGWSADDHRWFLARGWLAAACLPDIPRPLLFLDGQPGSAKTTRARLLLSVLDPREELGSSFGRNEDDERVTAYRRYLVGWDNITRASDAVSDSLCRLVTGEESSKRTLYADTGLTVMSFRRTGAITAVSVPSLRADALERLIFISCDPINATQRLSESRIWQWFETDHRAILGGLLDALVVMLRHLPSSRDREDGRVRMADFQDALHALDPHIAQVYAASVQDVMVEAAASDPFTSVVVEWLSTVRLPLMLPTVTEARLAAAEHRPSTDPRDFQPWWPTTDKAFSDALAKGAEPLRAMGYRVDRPARTKRGRPLRFSRIETSVQDALAIGGAK